MSSFKNGLIKLFAKIEISSYKAATKRLGGNIEEAGDEISGLIQDIRSFEDAVNKYIIRAFIEDNLNIGFIYPNARLKEHMKAVSEEMSARLDSIVQCLESLKTGTEGLEDTFYDMCIQEGKVALLLRFEILSEPELKVGDISFGSANLQLDAIGKNNKDYYLIAKRWQNTLRRFLPEIHLSDTAIVMQGPILYEDDFTLESLYRYRKIYPDTPIILSTWVGEVTDEFSYLATSINVFILENETPQETGPSNIKYQLKSSLEGIKAVKEFGDIDYVMKTRTDQRILKPDFLSYFRHLLRTYPCGAKELSERIVFLGGWNSMVTFPFRISDFMAFGTITDLINYYSASGDDEILEKTYTDKESISGHIGKWASRIMFEHSDTFDMPDDERRALSRELFGSHDPESYLCCSFYERVILRRLLNEEDDVLKHYWEFLKNYAIVADADQLLILWHKYKFMQQEWNSLEADGGLTQSVWLSLYYG